MIKKCKCHDMVPELDVVLSDFDEDVGGAVVAVAERGFVVHERAAVVFEATFYVS
jgi:hypothetical protein